MNKSGQRSEYNFDQNIFGISTKGWCSPNWKLQAELATRRLAAKLLALLLLWRRCLRWRNLYKPTHAARFTGLYMAVEPFYHPNHPFVHRVFHYFHHPFWGVNTPIFGLTPTFLYAYSLYSLLHLDCSIPRLSRVPGRTAQAMAAETACVILEGSLTLQKSEVGKIPQINAGCKIQARGTHEFLDLNRTSDWPRGE